MVESDPTPPPYPTSFDLGLGVLLALEFLGITYLICQRKIKNGDLMSAYVALIVASMMEIVTLLALGQYAARLVVAVMATGLYGKLAYALPGITMLLMYAFATGQLMYYLERILRERRGRSTNV